MPRAADRCPACGGQDMRPQRMYLRCLQCGHHHAPAAGNTGLVNQRLERASVIRMGALERYKLSVVDGVAVNRKLLVDVGSGAGGFLHHCRSRFTRCVGVEVTPSCVEFSRNQLGLEVVARADLVAETPSVVTFWHSLEHLPAATMEDTLGALARRCDRDSRVVVSVPNADWPGYRWAGGAYAFDDPDNHVHVFTSASLDLVMRRHGFYRTRCLFSAPYSAFATVQTALNVLTPPDLHDYAYHRLKRGSSFGRHAGGRLFWDAYTAALLAMTWPVAAGVFHDWRYPQRAAALTAVFAPTPPAC